MIRYLPLLLLPTFLMILLTGCARTKLAHTPIIDTGLPTISRLQSLGDITAIALEWEPELTPTIKGYYLYRKLKDVNTSDYERIAIINDRFVSHYIDRGLPSETKYLYYIVTFDDVGHESSPSEMISAITRSILRSVVYITSIDKMPRKAKLIWRPHQNGRINGYIVERKTPEQKEWKQIATLQHRYTAEFIDNYLDDNQRYMYRVKAVTFDKIISTPSDIVSVTTKALPKPIDEVDITTDLPKKIRLHWKLLDQKDISHYNVYRSVVKDSVYTLRAKITGDTFEDTIEDHGKNFFYQVSAVDYDGLESMRTQSWLGASISRPAAIHLRSATQEGNTTTLSWEKGDDRAIRYQVVSHAKSGWLAIETTTYDVNATKFTTTQAANVPVNYEVFAFDKYDIPSTAVRTADLVYEEVVQ